MGVGGGEGVGVVGKCAYKENPKSDLDLDLGFVNKSDVDLDLGYVNTFLCICVISI